MAFQLKWECEFCHSIIFSATQPEEYECDCYIERDTIEEESKEPEPMNNLESSERYRKQYKENGFTWNGEQPVMYFEAFDNFPDRSYLKRSKITKNINHF